MSDDFDDVFEDDVDSQELDALVASGETVPDDVPADGAAVFSSDRPFWRVSRTELLRALSLASALPSRATLYFCLYRGDGKVNVHCNNRDCVMNLDVSLVEDCTDGKAGNGKYFFEINQLVGFVSAYGDFVFSFDENDDIYFEAESVRHKLLCYRLDYGMVSMDVPPCKDEGVVFPLGKGQIDVFAGLFSTAPLSCTRMVLFPDKCVASFLQYLHVVHGDMGVSDPLVLRSVDLPVLSILANDRLLVAANEDRVCFRVPYGEVSFFRVPYVEETMPLVDTFAVGDDLGTSSVDIGLMKRALRLSALLGKSESSFRVDGSTLRLYVSDTTYFDVGSGTLSDGVPVGLGLLTKLFKTIPDSQVVMDCVFKTSGFDLLYRGYDQKTVYSVVNSVE